MIHRVRATIRFSASSGMAAWAKSQMAVRHQQAVSIHPGEPNEEPKRNEVIDDEDQQTIVCDLPLLNESHAADAFSTLTAASVLSWASEWSVEHHVCHHDETPPQPCEIVSKEVGL